MLGRKSPLPEAIRPTMSVSDWVSVRKRGLSGGWQQRVTAT
jgi:hypothetical protein